MGRWMMGEWMEGNKGGREGGEKKASPYSVIWHHFK